MHLGVQRELGQPVSEVRLYKIADTVPALLQLLLFLTVSSFQVNGSIYKVVLYQSLLLVFSLNKKASSYSIPIANIRNTQAWLWSARAASMN